MLIIFWLAEQLLFPQGELIYKMLGVFTFLVRGRAIAQAVSRWLPTTAAIFNPRSSHVGFVMDRVALGQVFYEYFGFPCQFSFHLLHHTHHLLSGAGTIWQIVAQLFMKLKHIMIVVISRAMKLVTREAVSWFRSCFSGRDKNMPYRKCCFP
jgi:hypothetical protein